jgi:hypothetical protein
LCAAVVWRSNCRADGGGAHANAHTTAYIGSAIGAATVGAARTNTTCMNTTGANTACMDSSGTAAAWTGKGLGRQARDPDDRGCQARHDDSV